MDAHCGVRADSSETRCAMRAKGKSVQEEAIAMQTPPTSPSLHQSETDLDLLKAQKGDCSSQNGVRRGKRKHDLER